LSPAVGLRADHRGRGIDKQIKAANALLTELVASTGSALQQLCGTGRPCAARRHQPLRQPGPLRLPERRGPDRRLLRRLAPPPGACPGGQPGATLSSRAVGSIPTADTSEELLRRVIS